MLNLPARPAEPDRLGGNGSDSAKNCKSARRSSKRCSNVFGLSADSRLSRNRVWPRADALRLAGSRPTTQAECPSASCPPHKDRPMTTATSASPDLKRKTADGSKAAAAGPLSADELRKMDAYWRASNYLSVGQIYLLDNPLLK